MTLSTGRLATADAGRKLPDRFGSGNERSGHCLPEAALQNTSQIGLSAHRTGPIKTDTSRLLRMPQLVSVIGKAAIILGSHYELGESLWPRRIP